MPGDVEPAERAEALKARTKSFALRVIRLVRALPHNDEARIIGRQVLRSATSIAANYRAVCRARSAAEFKAKLGIVVEEADETVFWLEMLVEAGIVGRTRLIPPTRESTELLSITAAAYRTARRRSAPIRQSINRQINQSVNRRVRGVL